MPTVDDDSGVANDDGEDDERTWTYTVEVRADDLWDSLVRREDDDDIIRSLSAFGVTSKGRVALVSGAVACDLRRAVRVLRVFGLVA